MEFENARVYLSEERGHGVCCEDEYEKSSRSTIRNSFLLYYGHIEALVPRCVKWVWPMPRRMMKIFSPRQSQLDVEQTRDLDLIAAN